MDEDTTLVLELINRHVPAFSEFASELRNDFDITDWNDKLVILVYADHLF